MYIDYKQEQFINARVNSIYTEYVNDFTLLTNNKQLCTVISFASDEFFIATMHAN